MEGSSKIPLNVNGDDLYDDVNGDGRKSFADVVLSFTRMNRIAATEPVSAFDYNGNGGVDVAGIVRLFGNLQLLIVPTPNHGRITFTPRPPSLI